MNATESEKPQSRAQENDHRSSDRSDSPPRADGRERREEPPSERDGNHGQARDPHQREGHEQRDAHAPAQMENPIPDNLKQPGTGLVIFMAVLLVALMAAFFVLGWVPHHRAVEQADSDAAAAKPGLPVVEVIRPRPEKTAQDVVLPCDLKANQQTAIYARANGFLKQWTTDIGGHVNKGDLLAVIDAPDLDAQLAASRATLEQAKATVIKSQADVDVALTDYNRYLKAQKENAGSVTQEDVDAKRAAYADAAGGLDVARATVVQDEAMVRQLAVSQDYERVYAPFSGTVTQRNYDVGALISPSNTSAGSELFDIADTSVLRVFVNVPQNYSTQIRIGQPAYLSVRNYPGREFTGVVALMAGALDMTTRTLPFELEFPNADGALYAGMYGQARLPITNDQPVLVVNSSALIFNAGGVQMAVVNGNKIHFQKITVGRDLGTELEITKGLNPDDEVVVNPGERITEGGEVKVTSLDNPPPANAPAASAN